MSSSHYKNIRRMIDPTGKMLSTPAWPDWVYYIVSLVTLATVVAVKLYLNPTIGFTTPYLLMSAAIVVSSLYGGFGPGLLTLILAIISVNVFFFVPLGSISVKPQALFPSIFFLLEGLLVVILGEERRQAVSEREEFISQEYLARTSAETSQKKSLFMSEASTLLAASLDNRTMLTNLARISVPFLADWSLMFLKQTDGTVTQVAVAHTDPIKIKSLKLLAKYATSDLGLTQTIASVTRNGATERIDPTSAKFFAHARSSHRGARILYSVGLDQALVVPLKTRHTILGAAVFAHEDNHRTFTPEDIEFIEDVARRTAMAVENGLLYEGARDEIAIRAQIEDELRHSRDQLRIILEGVAEGITVQDASGKLIFANDVAAQSVGLKSAAELVALPSNRIVDRFDMFDERGKPIYPSKLPAMLALKGKSPPEVVLRYRNKTTGEEHWSLIKAAPVMTKNNRVHLVINVNRNVTEQKIEELRKDEFIGIASHELKSPLTVLKAFTQVLTKKMSRFQDERTYEYLTRMNDQIDKLTNLINELLDVTRMRTGKLELHLEKTSIDGLLQTTVENLRRTTAHQLELRNLTNVSLLVDSTRISQVIINLVNNAVKYSPQANKVIINSALDKDHLIISVKDFGVGIGRQEQERIFTRFYQVRRTHEPINPGLGLGLYIAAQVVKAHGGQIWVESTKDKGATFSFSLPVQAKKRKRLVTM